MNKLWQSSDVVENKDELENSLSSNERKVLEILDTKDYLNNLKHFSDKFKETLSFLFKNGIQVSEKEKLFKTISWSLIDLFNVIIHFKSSNDEAFKANSNNNILLAELSKLNSAQIFYSVDKLANILGILKKSQQIMEEILASTNS
ncbi:MAG: hypothetical protein ACD_4C00238G0008 [uncultured bacterium (gcode 4)]|uniref:Uncharacterized protein n=1 Tax=uncultured bacterium (gcode 4) TaxID=1234023 RepID=K2G8X6_9BACT|nr:MAG: hypothetical protein ACD_4C00238G0008 [uncultured bacterium (gcode 4)]